MAFEIRQNSGSLFKNKNKREGKKDPDADGKLLLSADLIKQLYTAGGDQLVKVSAWTKVRDNGERWQSLAVRAWEERVYPPVSETQRGPGSGEFDDDIPF